MGRGRGGTQIHAQPMISRLLAVAAAMWLVVACSADTGTMRGIVVEVEGDLDNVTGFAILVEGDFVEFLPTPAGSYAFPLTHLREHLRTGEPVQVGWARTDDGLAATFLDDA